MPENETDWKPILEDNFLTGNFIATSEILSLIT